MIRSHKATLLAGLAVTATVFSGAGGVLAQDAGRWRPGRRPTGYTELDAALGADQPFKGKKVTIQTQWIGGEGDNFDATRRGVRGGHRHRCHASEELAPASTRRCCNARIEGDTPPDLAMLAQPSAISLR